MSDYSRFGSILNIATQITQMTPKQQAEASRVGIDKHGRIITAQSLYDGAIINENRLFKFFRKRQRKLRLRKASKRLVQTLSSKTLKVTSRDILSPERVLAKSGQIIAEKVDLKASDIELILKNRSFIESLQDCQTDADKEQLLSVFSTEAPRTLNRIASFDSGIDLESDDISLAQESIDLESIFYRITQLNSHMPKESILKALQDKDCVDLLQQDLNDTGGLQVKGIITAFTCEAEKRLNKRQSSLAALLRKHNMTLIQAEGDGSCMFHSLSEIGIKPYAEIKKLRDGVHGEMERYINCENPDVSEVLTESLEAIHTTASRLLIGDSPDLDPIDRDIGIENLYSIIIEDRVNSKEVLQRSQYMEPGDIAFLARVEKKLIFLLDIEGNVMGAVDETGRLLKDVKTVADIKYYADRPHHCLAFDQAGSHFLRVQVASS